MTTDTPTPTWESRTFTFEDWPYALDWVCLATEDRWLDAYLVPQARQYAWDNAQPHIQAALETWYADGWQAVDEVGAEAIQLHKWERTEQGFDMERIFTWLITCGIMLIIDLLYGIPPRRYICYRPVRLSLDMRRLVQLNFVA